MKQPFRVSTIRNRLRSRLSKVYQDRCKKTAVSLAWIIRSGPKRDYLEEQYDDVFVKTEQAMPMAGVLPLTVMSA